jgi:basic membrane protein A
MHGAFEGGVIVGTLENGGVDIAPFHDFEDDVPEALVDELVNVRAGIIDGSISMGGM